MLARTADGSSNVSMRKKPDIPSEEDCLGAIVQVARLVAMGLLETAQANAIRASFREILLYHRSKAKEAEKGISNVEVLDVLRKDPKLLSLFEPLLSQEQVEWILRGGDSEAEDAACWLGRTLIIEASVIGVARHVPKRVAEHDYGGSAVGEDRAPVAREGRDEKARVLPTFRSSAAEANLL